MGILPVKVREIADPLFARGFVLLGGGEPIVLVAVDWCEIRNDAYAGWRDELARAAGTTPDRVLLSANHQHDAPVVDLGAESLLAGVGLEGELCDVAFQNDALARTCAALEEAIVSPRRVTHIGVGRARVADVASSRRVVLPSGKATFSRGSRSGGDPTFRDAPAGTIDPFLRTLSLWDGDVPLLAYHVYATHPMSYYGEGEVSADFPGLARRRAEERWPLVFQIWATGASGDVTCGKYNDGARENRARLAGRLFAAVEESWSATRRSPIRSLDLRTAKLELAFRTEDDFSARRLEARLRDPEAPVHERILAAMGLASLRRIAAGPAIDVPSLDLGPAVVLLLPAESFVGYQLLAERLRPDVTVFTIGYGECWPGYIPTRAAFDEGFDEGWRWVGPGADTQLARAIREALTGAPRSQGSDLAEGAVVADAFAATRSHPRYSEGDVIELDDGVLLWATTEFSGGTEDDAAARIVSRTSRDGGRTWSDLRVLQENVGQRNVMSVSLLRVRGPDRHGIALFYLVKNGPGDLDVAVRFSEDEARSFDEPVLVTREPGYHVMNNDRVLQLSEGRLICPVSSTRDVREENHFRARVWLSDDSGRTWRAGRSAVDLPQRGAMEPGVVELADERLLLYLRTQLGSIWMSASNDGGDTWSDPVDWGIESPEAPATLERIPSTGDLLLIWNPVHVPGAGHGGPRTPLRAALSRDEGASWTESFDLETAADETFAYASVSFVRERVLLTYYVRDEKTGEISSRFRSLPLRTFYEGGR